MQQSVLSPDQYRDLSKKIIQSIGTRFRIVPLNSLKHLEYRLRHPIFISLEYDAEQVIASFDDIEAFSSADTESEAMDLLRDEIVSLYEDLKTDRDNLGPLPAKWLQLLEATIECK